MNAKENKKIKLVVFGLVIFLMTVGINPIFVGTGKANSDPPVSDITIAITSAGSPPNN